MICRETVQIRTYSWAVQVGRFTLIVQEGMVMQTILKTILTAYASTALIAACSTAPTETAANAKPDPRQGPEVKNICFGSQIRDWRENDRDSVIVEVAGRKEYKLQLLGSCEPQNAFMSIGVISRFGGGSCLTPGDQLVPDTRFANEICRIEHIYEWNKDAKPADAASAS